MIIAFCGSSGAGKSSLISQAKKLKVFVNKNVVVKQEDDFYLIKIAKTILGGNRFAEYKKGALLNIGPSKNQSLIHRLIPYFYAAAIYLEFVLEYINYEIVCKHKIILRDRYVYDYLVTLNQNMGLNNGLINYSFEQFPRPYLIFFVKINRQEALKRNIQNKAWLEHTGTKEKFHKRILNQYYQLAKKKNLIILDSNNMSDSCLNIVRQSFLRKEKLNKLKKIVICGIDGTGKTTLANKMCDYLDKLNIECKVVHFYHNSLLYQLLCKLGYYKIKNGLLRSNLNSLKQKPKPLIWAILHYLDAYVQYFLFLFFCEKSIIVFDRFFYDFIVSFRFYKIKGCRIFERFVPLVKNRFCLVSKPEISHQRKPENLLSFFYFCDNEYKKLAARHNIQLIDTTNTSIDEVFQLLLVKITNV